MIKSTSKIENELQGLKSWAAKEEAGKAARPGAGGGAVFIGKAGEEAALEG